MAGRRQCDEMSCLVPELIVSDIEASLAFYRLLGFQVRYARPEERFAYLERGGAEIMLEQPTGRCWLTGPMEAPYGRGINFQIDVDDVDTLYAAVQGAAAPIVLPIEEKWYRCGDELAGQRQFIVQDPDGYLLRFCQPLGSKPAAIS